ncbi:hypothetical protein [Haloferula sp. BvORR071]|uniref:hypothetical protein n=1 Tax=Haloferula sp. BvORR071 TaxID=1396141 RepID=UPI000554760F|nr:hypothetical protein [Haloferula sp. BvORR071]
MDAGVFGFGLLLIVAVFALGKYWRKQAAKVDAASLRDLINESNAVQDAELRRIIGHLEAKGLPQYALCLGRFLLLKQRIEKDIYRAQHLSLFAQEVEKGVDGICSEVCREITRIRDREEQLGEILTSRDPAKLERLESARRESHAAMLHAYTSIYQVHAEILGLGPDASFQAQAATAEDQPGKRLQEILSGLSDEADLIARTHARIQKTITDYPVNEGARPVEVAQAN